MRALAQSTAYDLMVFATDSTDHVTGKTGLTLTVTASKAGAAFGSISPTVTERGNGWYALALTSSHTDTLGDLAIRATGTGADPINVLCVVRNANTGGLAALPNAAAGANGGLPVLSSSATTLAYTVSTVTTLTGHTAQTGDAYAIVASGTHGNAALKTLIDAVDDYVDTEVGAIKTKTDQLTFTNSGHLDVAVWRWQGNLVGASYGGAVPANVQAWNDASLVAPNIAGMPKVDVSLANGQTVTATGTVLLDRLDAAITSRSSHAAADVWSVGTRALTDKAGFALNSTGLDAISTTAPSGVPTTFREMLVLLYRRFFAKTTLTTTQLKTYANDGTTVVTTQTVSSSGGTDTVGAAS